MAEKPTVLPVHLSREKKTIFTSLKASKKLILLNMIAFLLGRAGILQGLTPFGIGFFTAFNHKDRKYASLGITTLLGIITVKGIYESVPYGITLGIVYLLFQYAMDLRKLKTLKAAFISGFTYLTVSIIFLSFQPFYLYDVMMVAFEALVIFVIVYIASYALPIMLESKNRKILSTEEIICVAILMAIGLTGIQEVSIFQLSLRNSIAILLTILFAYNGGTAVGASVGITLGLITSMSIAGIPPVVIGIFGFSGLLAGIFKDTGKLGTGLGFLIGNAILTFYINGYYEVFIQFREIFLAFALFLLLPATWIQHLEKFTNNPKSIIYADQSHSERMKKQTYEKLMEFSGAFHELAATFEKISDKYEIFEKDDLTNLIQEVANYTCSNCGMKRSCWEKNFNATYQSMADLLVLIETRDSIEVESLPEEIRKRCIHPQKVMEKMTHLYELNYLDMTWKQQFIENRQLVGEQFKGVAEAVRHMAKDLSSETTFDIDLENDLYVALDKAGLSVKNIMVTDHQGGNLEITIEKNPCYHRESCINNFIPVISEAVGSKLVKKPGTCSYQRDGKGCSFTLVKANQYTAVTKVAKMTKAGNLLSGDTYTFMDIKDNQYLTAISDGMGTGDKAHRQSNATITMLEKMMEAGFDREVAIKTINSMLMLKSSEEIFSSLDMALLDLCNGRVDFVKIGSVQSFIKRSQTTVETIHSSTLPIGILKDIQYNENVQKIEDGDFIVMVSDGILEVSKEEGEQWLEDFLASTETRNPQDLADKILEKALNLNNNKVRDDMTVLVTKVFKAA
ncbi:stage II sporulation protein E [Clostridium formicaceticum]|uniref:Stage II sporulation protein E n=1 Tax=Clostridium formicaceticum TaxID=1497 RepID=A0AAC9RHY4_9CLOT|nr:stage II sporulation protein E [Clostridium formicaceticum]AOY75518.1 stage II sporulation protein E [Clostridium formicaceticum]ARE85810.1 Stage II sporulation protein E [Clostridium formicaceticum]